MKDVKTQLGKFYTIVSPFEGAAWDLFRSNIGNEDVILEPFAGSNNIPIMLSEFKWKSYDILPESRDVEKRDTIKCFPKGYKFCITNPPYLDVRTARKKGINYDSEYSDLYLESIDKMLENCDYVAAIIPSTFINKNSFKDRLWMWDKIDKCIFDDTGMPVGVAYFSPSVRNTKYYLNGRAVESNTNHLDSLTTFNVRDANLSACLIDWKKKKSIEVRPIENFDFDKNLKVSSRHHVAFYDSRIDREDIEDLNKFINQWRIDTHDFWLTSFKSTLPDGTYRKRMGFRQLSGLITQYVKHKN